MFFSSDSYSYVRASALFEEHNKKVKTQNEKTSANEKGEAIRASKRQNTEQKDQLYQCPKVCINIISCART